MCIYWEKSVQIAFKMAYHSFQVFIFIIIIIIEQQQKLQFIRHRFSFVSFFSFLECENKIPFK